jgi:hypothetical protein
VTAESRAPSRRVPVGPRERGSAALETAALLPCIIVAGILVLQAGVDMWGVAMADTAARAGARSASRGLDPSEAANNALPASLRVGSKVLTTPGEYDSVRVSLTIEVPQFSVLPDLTVERHAVMPMIR